MRLCAIGSALLLGGCNADVRVAADATFGQTEDGGPATEGAGTGADAGGTGPRPGDTGTGPAGSSGDGSADTSAVIFDLAAPDGGGRADQCKVVDGMDGVGPCRTVAPPDSFEPEIQWTWEGPTPAFGAYTPPLVANLTDDNDDGEIDLCDTPDVLMVVQSYNGQGELVQRIHILDGATGQEHFQISTNVSVHITPAIGDIDDDGLPEIVAGGTSLFADVAEVVAFEHDGTLKWETPAIIDHDQGFAIALADLDHDGDVEVIADDTVLDHTGQTVFTAPDQIGWRDNFHCAATVAADLDGDDDMEVILGQSAYRVDGSVYFSHPTLEPGFPQVANLDADPEPEILLTSAAGVTLIEHDGTVTWSEQTPTGDPPPGWFRPSTIHDFDGDGLPEFAASSATHYSVFQPDLTVAWTATVDDLSGWSAGTAFDFLGDGTPEAMYTDEQHLHVFDASGSVIFSIARGSPTLTEYPTVVDVDNDGSAEILVPSWSPGAPTLQVIRDADDRWIQARRIWNQHTYHVTNVREDGTIPQFEPKHWEALNTFRTNAQIEGGVVCRPEG